MPTIHKRNPDIRKIGILGAQGSHTHDSFQKYFPDLTQYEPIFCTTPEGQPEDWVFTKLLSNIREGRADCCLMPFFNTTEKHFSKIPNWIIESGLYVVDVFNRRIVQNLMSTDGITIPEITEVHSNKHCFVQCEKWLTENLPKERIAWKSKASSSEAAALIKENKAGKKYSLIGSDFLIQFWPELKIIASSVSKEDNFTSFFVISNRKRDIVGNPYSLWAFHLDPNEDSQHRTVRKEIENLATFAIVADWVSFDGDSADRKPKWYLCQISNGEQRSEIDKFEHEIHEKYPSAKLLGRFNKNISEYLLPVKT